MSKSKGHLKSSKDLVNFSPHHLQKRAFWPFVHRSSLLSLSLFPPTPDIIRCISSFALCIHVLFPSLSDKDAMALPSPLFLLHQIYVCCSRISGPQIEKGGPPNVCSLAVWCLEIRLGFGIRQRVQGVQYVWRKLCSGYFLVNFCAGGAGRDFCRHTHKSSSSKHRPWGHENHNALLMAS